MPHPSLACNTTHCGTHLDTEACALFHLRFLFSPMQVLLRTTTHCANTTIPRMTASLEGHSHPSQAPMTASVSEQPGSLHTGWHALFPNFVHGIEPPQPRSMCTQLFSLPGHVLTASMAVGSINPHHSHAATLYYPHTATLQAISCTTATMDASCLPSLVLTLAQQTVGQPVIMSHRWPMLIWHVRDCAVTPFGLFCASFVLPAAA